VKIFENGHALKRIIFYHLTLTKITE